MIQDALVGTYDPGSVSRMGGAGRCCGLGDLRLGGGGAEVQAAQPVVGGGGGGEVLRAGGPNGVHGGEGGACRG